MNTAILCIWFGFCHPLSDKPVAPVVIAGPIAKQPGYVVLQPRRHK